jgi:alkanesulfonate monooxygenase SsuD/methylene tetrahydromethanopterin reductase-like flavin-dependent oxidoreductase (luciferase family)
MLGIVAEYADLWNAWGRPDRIAHKSGVLDDFCAKIGRDPKAIARTAQAVVYLDQPIPAGQGLPAIGGSIAELTATIEQYRSIGLDELIVPDGTLGKGAGRRHAMDTILALVRS